MPLSLQIDLQKMPLGKLSRRQIQAAYSILSEVQQVSKRLQPGRPLLYQEAVAVSTWNNDNTEL
jgi:hypothetical protein